MPNFENKLIEVCTECGRACCYQGEFMCAECRDAGTELKTVAELREKQYGETEHYWSDERLTLVYGDPAPHGYKNGGTKTMPIEIIENGYRFVMEKTSAMVCEGCALKSTDPRVGEEVCKLCALTRRAEGLCLICTSVAPVQEKAKVYHSGMTVEADQELSGKPFEGWSGSCWVRKNCLIVKSHMSAVPYIADDGYSYSLIREIPARRLTQAQIVEAHPDLEGVELVGGWE